MDNSKQLRSQLRIQRATELVIPYVNHAFSTSGSAWSYRNKMDAIKEATRLILNGYKGYRGEKSIKVKDLTKAEMAVAINNAVHVLLKDPDISKQLAEKTQKRRIVEERRRVQKVIKTSVTVFVAAPKQIGGGVVVNAPLATKQIIKPFKPLEPLTVSAVGKTKKRHRGVGR